MGKNDIDTMANDFLSRKGQEILIIVIKKKKKTSIKEHDDDVIYDIWLF